jgi:chaperone required for assembly of F1-ATPase
MTAPQLRRFWTEAAVTPHPAGCAVTLDGKTALTPARNPLATPHRRLAEAVAQEWACAPDVLEPQNMALTGLLNAVIDRVGAHRAAMAADIARIAAHELLCYRADKPAGLVARQAAAWDPVLSWLKSRYDVHLNVGAGLMHIEQPPESHSRLAAAVAALDPYRLTAAIKLTGITKSLALTLAALQRQMSPADAHDASRIDERFQAEHWGEDAEATRRVAKERAELDIVSAFLSALD